MNPETKIEIRAIVNQIGELLREFPPREMQQEAEKQTGLLSLFFARLASNLDQAGFCLAEIETILKRNP